MKKFTVMLAKTWFMYDENCPDEPYSLDVSDFEEFVSMRDLYHALRYEMPAFCFSSGNSIEQVNEHTYLTDPEAGNGTQRAIERGDRMELSLFLSPHCKEDARSIRYWKKLVQWLSDNDRIIL